MEEDHLWRSTTHNYLVELQIQPFYSSCEHQWRRVLVDTGALCDIMYTSLFKTLQLTEKNLSLYVGNELYRFNGLSTQPWGYVELLVTFGEKEAKKTIKIPFLVIDCPYLYNCIIGRIGLA